MYIKQQVLDVLNNFSFSHLEKIVFIHSLGCGWDGDDPRRPLCTKKDSRFIGMLTSLCYFWGRSRHQRDPNDWKDIAPLLFKLIRDYIESDRIEYQDWDEYKKVKEIFYERWSDTYDKYPREMHELDKG